MKKIHAFIPILSIICLQGMQTETTEHAEKFQRASQSLIGIYQSNTPIVSRDSTYSQTVQRAHELVTHHDSMEQTGIATLHSRAQLNYHFQQLMALARAQLPSKARENGYWN